jgi:hypothetical protein
MKAVTLTILMFVLSKLYCSCQGLRYQSIYSVVFDSAKEGLLLKQCSRASPLNIEGFWTHTQKEIDALENNFRNLYTHVIRMLFYRFKN